MTQRVRGRRRRRRVAALTLGGCLVALAGCSGGPDGAEPSSARSSPAASPTASPRDPVAYATMLLRETNDVRKAADLPDLAESTCARDAARLRAVDLVGLAELTHASLTGVITDCAPATTAAENLSRAAASPPAVVGAWMGSPGHRSNLLDPALTELGVGCVPDGDAMLCSQVFLGP